MFYSKVQQTKASRKQSGLGFKELEGTHWLASLEYPYYQTITSSMEYPHIVHHLDKLLLLLPLSL